MNEIWIELKPPTGTEPAGRKSFANDQCRLANNLLARCAKADHLPLKQGFFYSAHENRYCYGGDMGYVTLSDNGKWLNLDYMGREPQGPAAADNGEPTPLECLSYASRAVIGAWESGDLAQAVRDLSATLATISKD